MDELQLEKLKILKDLKIEELKHDREVGLTILKGFSNLALLTVSATVATTFKYGFSSWTIIGGIVFCSLLFPLAIVTNFLLSLKKEVKKIANQLEEVNDGK